MSEEAMQQEQTTIDSLARSLGNFKPQMNGSWRSADVANEYTLSSCMSRGAIRNAGFFRSESQEAERDTRETGEK